MNNIIKKHILKIPKNTSIYYCSDNQIVIVSNLQHYKVFKLKTKLIVKKAHKIIKVTRIPFFKISNNYQKKLKAIQATQVTLLKQLFLDNSSKFCKKLKLVGVGFRVSTFEILTNNFLHFKLGYSHSIYFKIPKNLKTFCMKSNTLFIVGDSYSFVTQIAALIKSLKIPELYKGKGILYTTEKIILKEGKKV